MKFVLGLILGLIAGYVAINLRPLFVPQNGDARVEIATAWSVSGQRQPYMQLYLNGVPLGWINLTPAQIRDIREQLDLLSGEGRT